MSGEIRRCRARSTSFLVFRRKIGKRRFIGGTNDRHHDSILGFHGDAHVDGGRLHNAAAMNFAAAPGFSARASARARNA